VNEDKSVRYHRLKRRTAVLSMAMSGALLIALVVSGAAALLRELTHGSPSLFVLVLAVMHETVTLPIAFYGGFLLERRYGLSAETARMWLTAHAKAAMLALALAIAAAETIYWSMGHWPRAWFLASAILFTVATAVLARVTPTLLLPLFYRFKPLERDSLRDRLAALSARAGLPVLGVYEWGLGEKTRRANAALVGAGATRRILLSDTLLADYSEDEIEVILAHEMGHHVHHDILKGIALQFALLAAALGGAALVVHRWWGVAGLAGPADVAGLPLLLVTAGAVSVLLTPAVNAFSRRNERRADRYALALTQQAGPFISAMRRLAAQNMAEENPSRPALWFFHSHPPVDERIAAASEISEEARQRVDRESVTARVSS
jgi:STE24 endopeptidase